MVRAKHLVTLSARAMRFGVSGAVATLIAYVTFIIGLQFWHYAWANVFSWCISVTFGFLMNRRFTFGIRGRENGVRDLAMFLVGALLQLGLSMIGLRILIGALHLNATLAFVINLVFTSSFSFAYLNLIAFRRRAHLDPAAPATPAAGERAP
jgi:putative flippase GtrA